MSFSSWFKNSSDAEPYRVALSLVSLSSPEILKERLTDMVREMALSVYRKSQDINLKDDPLERVIACALSKNGIPFTRDNHSKEKGRSLDFGLPCNVGIEVKQYFCDRSSIVLQKNSNVILVQGRQAANTFAGLINRGSDLTLKETKNFSPSYSIKEKTND